MRERIKNEFGFTVNIGISSNKLLAKMASDFKKPDRVHTLYPEEIKTKMWPLPVSNLFFCGRATTKKLFSVGTQTIEELATTDPKFLKTLLSAANLTIEIYQAACALFANLRNGQPIRHLGIHTSRVEDGAGLRQLNLFDEINYEKLSLLDKMVDNIRECFGIDSIMHASFLNQPIAHMCGGISREKSSVDYDKIVIQ